MITGFFLALSLSLTLLIFQGIDPAPLVSTNILLLTLINVNITLVVVLVLLLSRNVIKFFFERRQKSVRFKTRLIAAFVGLSLIPAVLLFVVASGLLTSSIENWFSIQVERSLNDSLEIAQRYYHQTQETTKQASTQIAQALQDQAFFNNDPIRIQTFLKKKRDEYQIEAIHLTTPDKTLLASTDPKEERGLPFPMDSDLFKKAAASPITMTQESEKGEMIRALSSVQAPGETGAVLVVDYLIPTPLVETMERIKSESEEYKQLKAFKNPIKGSYLLSFFIVVLLILFSATWFAVYLARGITVPIDKLVEGTAAVAHGDLDFQIDLDARDEFGALVASFNKMTHDLKQSREERIRAQKLATWQEVALQMAHDIKNPLTPIQLSTERLRKKHAEKAPDFDAVFDQSTQIIINEVQGLTALVNEFSNFARLPLPHRVSQRIEPILQEVLLLYQSGHKDISFNAAFDEKTPPLLIDRDQIKRAFVNLFENAVEAIPQNGGDSPALQGRGEIGLSTRYDEAAKQVSITVSDTGEGIAPDDIDKLFLPYFSRKKRGTGLGLAIVHRIVLDHGGHISVAPRTRKGTTFTIVLPAAG